MLCCAKVDVDEYPTKKKAIGTNHSVSVSTKLQTRMDIFAPIEQ